MTSKEDQRHTKKMALADMIERMSELPIEEVVGVFSVRYRVSIRTANEYLKELRAQRLSALVKRGDISIV